MKPNANGITSFQAGARPWLLECFGLQVAADQVKRSRRFLEEALDVVQTGGCLTYEVREVVASNFGRPVGHLEREVGIMVMLPAVPEVKP